MGEEGVDTQSTRGTTRRNFIKGLAAGATGLALSGMVGCASTQDKTRSSRPQAGGYPYAVHSTDVLVVGAGLTGKAAARVAMRNGANVIVIDKGKYGHSGNSVAARAAISVERSDDPSGVKAAEPFVIDLLGIADQDYVVANMKAGMENPFLPYYEQSGNPLGRTGANGAMFPEGIEDQAFAFGFVMWRSTTAQDLVRRGIEIHDRMMMIDIVTDETGRAAGVVAIDLTTSQAHLFRAKSVILATSSFQWAQGQTVAGPDTTGEGCAALMRRGIAMRDIELNCVDIEGGGPYDQMLDGPDQGWFETANAIVNPIAGMCLNTKGEDFMAGFFSNPNLSYAETFVGGVLCLARELGQGNGNEDGSVYVDIEAIKKDWWMGQYYERWKNIDDGSVDFDHVKIYGESFGSGASPKVDYETFETEIPGLYNGMPSISSFPSAFCWGTGQITGAAAAKAAADASMPGYQEEEVQAILAKSYSWLEKEFTKDSIRPVNIVRNIQGQFAKNLLWLKNKEGIQSAIDELQRIRDEDLPRMATSCKSMVMNREWRNAMEVESMLTMSLAAAAASLERKESRPMHFRTDYPKIDNQNYLAHLWVTLNKDGTYSVKKTDIDGSYISREDLIAKLPDIDISQPNPA